MNTIEHSSIFELLSVDLDLAPMDIKDILTSKGTSAFLHYLKKQDLWMHKTELKLETEIKDPHGKVLINSGIILNKYLPSLLERYIKDDNFYTSSFGIECTDSVLEMYRSKTCDKMNSILTGHIYNQDSLVMLFENIPDIQQDFDSMMHLITEKPKGICALLRILNSFNGHKDLIIKSINSSLITLAISSISSGSNNESKRIVSLKTGMANILMNMDAITGQELCESTSAEIIKMLIGDDALEQAILIQSAAGETDRPIFTESINRTNLYLRMLATVGLFTELINQNNSNAHDLEIHKLMYEMCDKGFADREVTKQLSKLFLPEAKYLILDHAYSIRKTCTNTPAIWSTIGDMLPVKFICDLDECDNCGSHKTYIPKDVVVKAGSTLSTCIMAGIYFTCNKLTDELQTYYKEVVRAS